MKLVKKYSLFVLTTALLPNVYFAQNVCGGNIYALYLCGDSTVRAWGDGSLGDSSMASSNFAVKVHSVKNIVAIAAAGHSLALRNDGTVWSFGINWYGQLGDCTTVMNITYPVQVHGAGNIGFLTGVRSIACGAMHSIALKNDSTVWAWGLNSRGQLGDSSSQNNRYVPVKVKNLSGIIAIAGGGEFSLALKKDGTVWTWGSNIFGELGNGTISATGCMCDSVPKQVPGLTGIVSIAASNSAYHALVLKNDSTVWAWGNNNGGQLGDNTVNNIPSPIQVHGPGNVGFLTGIKKIAVGSVHSMALKNDETIFTWGANSSGQLGDGTTNDRHVPQQLPGINNVTQIACGSEFSLFQKNDGTVWSFGYNYDGQLGDGAYNTTGCYCSSLPVQVWGPCNIAAGISESQVEETHILVYPNPMQTTGRIQITGNGSGQPFLLKLYNYAGLKVREIVCRKSFLDIEKGELTPGMYIYCITDPNGRLLVEGKLMIQ